MTLLIEEFRFRHWAATEIFALPGRIQMRQRWWYRPAHAISEVLIHAGVRLNSLARIHGYEITVDR